MRRRAVTLALALALAATLTAGCSRDSGPAGSGGSAGGAHTPSALPSDAARTQARLGKPQVLATGLEVPWGLAFLPGGGALVTERDSGRLLRVTANGETTEVTRFGGIDPAGEGGLLGLELSPRFERDRRVYVYYSTQEGNRVARFEYRRDGTVGERHVLVDGIPHAAIHNGGRLLFGPDGMLYATTGESGQGSLAQDRNSLGGKILRMTPEGEPAPGNPFDTLVWTYGHRNVEGIAFSPENQLYASEFGGNRFDELNLIISGHNYGWPEVEGFGDGDNYTDPLLTWEPAEASPAGVEIAGGSVWVASLRGERLWRVPLGQNGKTGEPKALFVEEYGRLRTVALAPSGDLWVMTSNRDGRGDPGPKDDRIIRIPLK